MLCVSCLGIRWRHDIWISEKLKLYFIKLYWLIFYYQKELSKLLNFFFLVWKVLSFRHTKQTSKNVADTISKHNCLYIKTMWFINFSTKHPICKIFLRLNRCLIKVKTKTLQVWLSQFCDHSQLLLIVFK